MYCIVLLLASHVLQFWGILVTYGEKNRLPIGIPISPLAGTLHKISLIGVKNYISMVSRAFFFIKIVRREKHRITRHNSAELQTTKQTLATSKHSTEFT